MMRFTVLISLCLIVSAVFWSFSPWTVYPSDALEKSETIASLQPPDKMETAEVFYQDYINFFEEVFQTMQENYYHPVSEEQYQKFLKKFDEEIYSQLKETGKSIDYIRWRSSAHLVDYLKSPDDIFSAFIPPKPAKEYEQKALGKRVDLGIKGKKVDLGFVVEHIEPRSDAFAKGLKVDHLIVWIDQYDVSLLSENEIKELLNPLIDTKVSMTYLDYRDKKKHEIKVISKEYFKQTVFMLPVKIPGIYGLEIKKFNKETAKDLFRFLEYFRKNGPILGILFDLRGNPGGPPLAARELAGFFLPAGEEFAYFKRRSENKFSLDVPEIPDEYRFVGPVAILVDELCGSAAELFSGIMQRRGRAVLIGQNTAGQVYLKSMFNFDDDSMLLLVTARGHYPDGAVFSFDGLHPDRIIEENEDVDLVKYAMTYLVYVNSGKNN